MSTNLPAFSTIEELRSLYQELSAPPKAYFKSLVRVKLSKRAFVTRSLIHTETKHVGLLPENYRGAVAVDLVTRHTEITCGLLYTPQVSSQPRHMTVEWALCFKIDCDIARKKTGSIDAALAHYVADSSTRSDRESISKLRGKLSSRAGIGGRPRKLSNTEDLLVRYGKRKDGHWDLQDPTTEWVLDHRAEIDAGEFTYDGYRDPVIANSSFGLEEVGVTDRNTLRLDFGMDILGDG